MEVFVIAVGGIVLLAFVAAKAGPMRGRGGSSSGTPLTHDHDLDESFRKPPNEGDML